MTKRERMMSAIRHIQPDRLPCGELAIEAEVANRLLGGGFNLAFQDFEREKAVRALLDIDFINVGDWPVWQIGEDASGAALCTSVYGEQFITKGASKHVVKPPFEDIEEASSYPKPDIGRVSGHLVQRFVEETDLFVFAQIGGPISMLNEMLGMEEYMVYCITDTEHIATLARTVMAYEVEKAKLFIDSGAHAILLADDMAFNTGLLLPPDIMEVVVFPFYEAMIREIKAYRDLPVFLHTDGDINLVMDRIVGVGFDGLHSLQPTANMDLGHIKRQYGRDLCLIGNIDLNQVLTFDTPVEVRQNVRETIQSAFYDGGYVLSSCNILMNDIPPENILAMYDLGLR